MTLDVFISYKQADRIAAEHVCSSLQANGIHCWIAPRNIAPSSEWAEAIKQAIKSAKALVLMLSSHSKSSRQLAREVENADEHRLKTSPSALRTSYRPRTSTLDSPAVAASVPFLAEVSLGVNLEPYTPPSEARQLNWRKPWFLVAGGLALLLVAGLLLHFAGPSS